MKTDAEIHWIPAMLKVEQVPLERCSSGLFVDANNRVIRIVSFSNEDGCITLEAEDQDGAKATQKFDADEGQHFRMWRVVDL